MVFATLLSYLLVEFYRKFIPFLNHARGCSLSSMSVCLLAKNCKLKRTVRAFVQPDCPPPS